MSKNSSTIIVGIITVVCMALIVMNQDKDSFERPMTIEDNVIWIDFQDSKMDMWIDSVDDIYGFQFEFDGATLGSTDGGVLNREGFNISNNERVLLSFSFEGKFIPAGEHLLISIDTTYPNGKNNVKMTNMVLAGEGGKSLAFSYYNSIYKTTTFRTN